MLILIAESKTMTPCAASVAVDDYRSHMPLLEPQADMIMDSLRAMSVELLAGSVKISTAMARRLHSMIYDFPNKGAGESAVEAFTGVVFRALDYRSLDEAARKRCTNQVRIISSLYGLLRPDDIVKPYRFDFTTSLAPEGKTFSSYWRDKVTDIIAEELRSGGFDAILNLLPADAARCIDWARIRKITPVYKADFLEPVVTQTEQGDLTDESQRFRTPNANRLKTLRGKLLRRILTDDSLNSASSLLTLDEPDFCAEPSLCSLESIAFLTAP